LDCILEAAEHDSALATSPQRTATKAAQKAFLEHYGPMGLRQAHDDIVAILSSVFKKFSHTKELLRPLVLRALGPTPATALWNNIWAAQLANTEFVCETTLQLLHFARSFNGDNWDQVKADIDQCLTRVDSDGISIRALVAMHLLNGIREAGHDNPTWARVYEDLYAMKERMFAKDQDLKPDRLLTLYDKAQTGMAFLQDQPAKCTSKAYFTSPYAAKSGTILGSPCAGCAKCPIHCHRDGKWRNPIAPMALRRKPRPKAFICDAASSELAGTAEDLRLSRPRL